ncbi:MAG: glycosyltransferase, partial [Oceanihabitans sp.]
GTGPETEALKFACYQLGLGKETVFLGKLDHNQVKNALEKAQIYIQYSVQEGFCNAVLEAQAMGLLCVVSDAEGLSENVLHNKTGWVVSKRNPKALANKILEVIHLPEEEKNRVCNQSQIRIKETFNLDIQKQLFHSFYK